MAVLEAKLDVGELHAIHDGLDCSTFTGMALSCSQRRSENFFFGTSAEAYATNLRYHYLVALHLHLHQQGQTRHCVRTAENPKATRRHHPLTTHGLERPKAAEQLARVSTTHRRRNPVRERIALEFIARGDRVSQDRAPERGRARFRRLRAARPARFQRRCIRKPIPRV